MMQPDRARCSRLAVALSLSLLAACGGTRSSEPTRPGADEPRGAVTESTAPVQREWLSPSPTLKRQIDIHLAKLPWLQTLEERVEAIEWFVGVGEPVYPYLLECVVDPRPKVSGTALAVIGAMRDPRLVEPLRALPWPAEDQTDLRLERARTHVQLGDWGPVDILIDGLEDPRPVTRALCHRTLQRSTKLDFGFDPRGEEEARSTAVARWREWSSARAGDPLLDD